MGIAGTTYQLYERIALRKVPFFIVFFVAMCLTYGFFLAIDFVPEPKTAETASESDAIPAIAPQETRANGGLVPQQEEQDDADFRITVPEETSLSEERVDVAVTPGVDALPVRITFDALDTSVAVENPMTTDVATLDAALLHGAVRHPASADFADEGNMFILGHSSYLPNVLNQNFQAFNGIQKLSWGDIVRVESPIAEYVYRVERVYEAKASELTVPNSRGEAQLTLATCDSFGSKDDRFILEATLIETRPL